MSYDTIYCYQCENRIILLDGEGEFVCRHDRPEFETKDSYNCRVYDPIPTLEEGEQND